MKPFYQRTWFIWLMLFLFYPVGCILLWLYGDYSKRTKGIIMAIFAVWFIIGNFASPRKGTIKQTTSSNSVETTPNIVEITPKTEEKKSMHVKPTAFPESMEDINGYIVSAIEDKYQNKTTVNVDPSTNTPGGYIIETITSSNDLDINQSKSLSRDVIVATYDAIYEKNLPVIYVSFSAQNEQEDRIFLIGIGKNVADKVGREKWNLHSGNSAFSSDDFIVFARNNQAQAITKDGKTHFEDRCIMK